MASHRVAVILAGSGVYDGSEVHEASAALVALSRNQAQVGMFAPDKEQLHAIDHTKELGLRLVFDIRLKLIVTKFLLSGSCQLSGNRQAFNPYRALHMKLTVMSSKSQLELPVVM